MGGRKKIIFCSFFTVGSSLGPKPRSPLSSHWQSCVNLFLIGENLLIVGSQIDLVRRLMLMLM